MWYEILPSLGLVYACITAPHLTNRAINWFFYNGKLRVRYWEKNGSDFHLYLRDRRLTGSEYVPRGLEGIPDRK